MSIDVRKELDRWLPKGPQACFEMMEREFSPRQDGSEADMRLQDPRRIIISSQIVQIRDYIERLGWEEARPEVETMARYFFEGLNTNSAGYQEDDKVYDQLGVSRFLRDGGSLVDLGCGPGHFLRRFPVQAMGVDISPSFALANPQVVCGTIDASFETFIKQVKGYLPSARPRWAISSLTLDRVRDPRAFLQTLARLGNTATAATLLPIVPVDDGPKVKNRITYTPENLRLTPGSSEEEDRRILQQYLEDTFKVTVDAQNIPYVCRSSDGEQTYRNYWAFTFPGQCIS